MLGRNYSRLVIRTFLALCVAVGSSVSPAVAEILPHQTGAPLASRLMHRDLDSTDSLPWSGPGNNHTIASSIPGGACSTVLQGTDGIPIGLCTRYLGLTYGITPIAPSIVLFDPATAVPRAHLELRKYDLFGGVYAYLDEQDRVVIAEGHRIVRVAHSLHKNGWKLYVDDVIDLPPMPKGSNIAGLVPDGSGNIWFITKDALLGCIQPNGTIKTIKLGKGEKIANGLTPRPRGVSVLTTHKLYEVTGPTPTIKWKITYDRGSGRKPGQLSWGSGTTPTFFGPNSSRVAIVDNKDGSPDLLVFDAETGKEVCRMQAFSAPFQGTENSIMAHGNSLWIPSTYGFEYPELAVDGPLLPEPAVFNGGLTRVDLVNDKCVRRWENHTRIATLPMLTLKDFRIWAFSTDLDSNNVSLISVDARTGKELTRTRVGVRPFDEPMQLTGLITPRGEVWQATATRMIRVYPTPPKKGPKDR